MPAVFVHGVPETFRIWDAVRAEVARPDTVALALPGFDAPIPTGFAPTKEAYAAWVVAELEAFGEPVDLVGHDWGSLLVQRVASTRPDLIRTWAAGSGPVDAEYVWHDTAQLMQTPEVGEQVMAGMSGDGLYLAFVDEIGEAAARALADHVDDTMKSCILALYRSAVTVGAEWQPAVDALGPARPAAVIWGRHDAYAPVRFGERLAERVGAELVVLDSGHFWPAQRPVEAAAALTALWARG
jgi:hypothetical protein